MWNINGTKKGWKVTWQRHKTKSEDVASISDPTIGFCAVLQDRFTFENRMLLLQHMKTNLELGYYQGECCLYSNAEVSITENLKQA